MPLHIPISRIVTCMGALAMLPMIVLAASLGFVRPAWQPVFLHHFITYASLILAAIGAMHWGDTLEQGRKPATLWRYAYGACPLLLAWVILSCPPSPALFLLFCGYVASFIVDRAAWRHLDWFVTLRAFLTGIATTCLCAAYNAL